MQNFAVAGGALNGSPEVLMDDATVSIVLQAAGEGMRGAMGEGIAGIALYGGGALLLNASLSGAAGIALSGTGLLARGTTLTGSAAVALANSGDFTRRTFLEGLSAVELYGDCNIFVVAPVSATFAIQLNSEGDLNAATGQAVEGAAAVVLNSALAPSVLTKLEGTAQAQLAASGDFTRWALGEGAAEVVLSSSLNLAIQAKLAGAAEIALNSTGSMAIGLSLIGTSQISLETSGDFTRWVMIHGLAPIDLEAVLYTHSVKATQLDGLAQVELASIGTLNAQMKCPPGIAMIELASHGTARTGAKLELEGDSVIEVYSRGSMASWHYVFAEGQAVIQLLAKADKVGVPAFPEHYIVAPANRALRVNEELRRFIVPAERRL